MSSISKFVFLFPLLSVPVWTSAPVDAFKSAPFTLKCDAFGVHSARPNTEGASYNFSIYPVKLQQFVWLRSYDPSTKSMREQALGLTAIQSMNTTVINVDDEMKIDLLRGELHKYECSENQNCAWKIAYKCDRVHFRAPPQ